MALKSEPSPSLGGAYGSPELGFEEEDQSGMLTV